MRTSTQLSAFTQSNILNTFYTLNKKGGPDATDYGYLRACIESIPHLLSQGVLNIKDIELIKDQCEFLKTDISVMGHIKMKPMGYAGDYLIIERIYQDQVSEKYLNWDLFSMTNPAAAAVKNRKQFFKTLIIEKLKHQETIQLLNIASGPARDLKEIYEGIDPSRLETTCIEIDQRAIDYAKKICCNYTDEIQFFNQNIFKYQTDKKFDIIWSAGLFDYFDDKTFIQLMSRLQNNLKEYGEICIGNFSRNNPGRVYMEVFGEWFLNHRSKAELAKLAILAGAEKNKIRVEQEPLGVNLFLRVMNKAA